MNSQDFLLLNLLAAGGFLAWYLVSRGGPQRPTALNMKAPDTISPIINPLPPEELSRSTAPQVEDFSRAKVLNVMFIYNGHSWDAHEVLGVPAGASMRIVTEAYQLALRRCQGESVEFIETAYRAILNRPSA